MVGRLILGIDPGTRNFANAWLDTRDLKMELEKHDIFVSGGARYTLKKQHYRWRAAQMIRRWEPKLKHTGTIHYERMSHPKANKLVKEYVRVLMKGIRRKYPGIKIVCKDPYDVKELMGIHGEDYKDRKKKSVARMKRLMRGAVFDVMRKRYGAKLDDVSDASFFCFYAYLFPDEEEEPEPEEPLVIPRTSKPTADPEVVTQVIDVSHVLQSEKLRARAEEMKARKAEAMLRQEAKLQRQEVKLLQDQEEEEPPKKRLKTH